MLFNEDVYKDVHALTKQLNVFVMFPGHLSMLTRSLQRTFLNYNIITLFIYSILI